MNFIVLLIFCLLAFPAQAADGREGKAQGRFMLDIGGNNNGMVQSVEPQNENGAAQIDTGNISREAMPSAGQGAAGLRGAGTPAGLGAKSVTTGTLPSGNGLADTKKGLAGSKSPLGNGEPKGLMPEEHKQKIKACEQKCTAEANQAPSLGNLNMPNTSFKGPNPCSKLFYSEEECTPEKKKAYEEYQQKIKTCTQECVNK